MAPAILCLTPAFLRLTLAILCLTLAARPLPAVAADRVGRVVALAGAATVRHSGDAPAHAVYLEAPVFQGDVIATGPASRVRVRFDDESLISLGERTRLRIDGGHLAGGGDSLLLRISQGVYRAIVRALMPRAVFEVRTNTAVASVRGTDWMAEVTPDATAVVTLEGAVSVASVEPGVGGAVILRPGEGTTVKAGQPPSPVKRWGAARVQGLKEATDLP